MDKKKWWIAAGVVALVVAIVAVLPVYLSKKINDDFASVLVAFGSEATGTKVTLGKSEIDLFSGEGTIEEFAIPRSNEGEEGSVVYLGYAAFKVDPMSIWFGPLKIETLKLRRSVLNLNVVNGKTTLDSILKPISSYAAKSDSSFSDTRIVLDHFEILTGALKVLIKKQNGGRTYIRSKVIPLVKMAALGANEKGMSPALLVQRILREMDVRVNEVAANQGWFKTSLAK